MNLTISGHHLEVTPALREYVLTKLDRVTRHFDQVVDINVLLSVEKLKEKERRQKAEVTLHVKGKDIFVKARTQLVCRDHGSMDKLDRQVCRHKGDAPGSPRHGQRVISWRLVAGTNFLQWRRTSTSFAASDPQGRLLPPLLCYTALVQVPSSVA
jgi:putative sigma-54 modulation protein